MREFILVTGIVMMIFGIEAEWVVRLRPDFPPRVDGLVVATIGAIFVVYGALSEFFPQKRKSA